MSQSFLYNPSL